MKKRITALLVAVCMMATNLSFIPVAWAEEAATGIAGAIVTVPSSGETAASGTLEGEELHNTSGQSLALRHEEDGSFLVIDEAVATMGNTVNSVIAKFFAGDRNSVGLSYDITDSSAIAIRVKFNDNSTAITYNPAAFKVVLAKDGAVSDLANATIDHTNTAKWLDLGDASLTKMYPTDYASDNAVAYQFMGNMDGYMILPIKLFGEGFAAADLKESFESIQIIPVSTYANDADAAADGSKYSTYKNRELLIGDIVFVDDVDAFTAYKTEGMTKYASGLNDGAYTGQAIRGYRNHYYANYTTDSTSNLSNNQSNISNPTQTTTGGYMHMAVIPGGDVAVRVAPNNVARTVFGYTFIDSYDGRNTDNILNANSVLGAETSIIPSNGVSMTTGVVMRVYVTGNEGKTINIKPFYSKEFAKQGFYTFKSGVSFKFIEANTGKYRELLSTANGLPIEGNVDGWIYIPGFSGTYWAGGNAIFEGNGLLNGLLGFGAYVNDISSKDQIVYFGDVDFIKNEQAFYDVHIGCKNDAHVFDNACDAYCNDCFYTREVSHDYPYNCSTECTVCGTVREPMGHSFENLEDTICVGCGAEVPKNVVNTTVVKPSDTTNNFVKFSESDIIQEGTLRGAFVKAATTDKKLLTELTDNGAIAIRIKFNDNSKAVTFNPAAFRLLLAAKGGDITEESSALANSVIDHVAPAMWLDMDDTSLTKMYPTDYASDNAVAYQFMGNMNGYMIIPIKLFGSKYTAQQLKDYFKYIAIEPIATIDSEIPTDGSKYSSYKDRELLVGDVSFIADIDAFAKSKTEGMTRYASGLEDTAFTGQAIRGYKNHFSIEGADKLKATQKDLNNPTTSATGGYMHIAVLPDGSRAIKATANAGTSLSSANTFTVAYSFIDSYDGRNADNTIANVVKGTENSIIANATAGKDVGFAIRLHIENNEGKTIKIHPFYSKSLGVKGFYTLKPGSYKFVGIDGKLKTLKSTDTTGIPITGNVDGWLIIPDFSNICWDAGSNAFEGDGLLTGLLGFGVYLNGLSDNNQAVYLGDVKFIKDDEKFLNTHVGCKNDAHVFDNTCDPTCNDCYFTREANHTREFNCSEFCKVCGDPIIPLGHTYDNLEDTTCNDCGFVTLRNIKHVSVVELSKDSDDSFVKLTQDDMLKDGVSKGAAIKATVANKDALADITDNGAVAIRIKLNDNSKNITLNPAAFRVLLSAQGGKVTEESSALANITIDHTNTAMWLDMGDASYTKMYPTDYKSDNAANYQLMGNMDGYLVIPLKLFGKNYTAKQIKDYFKYVAVQPIVTEAADMPTDGSKYSSYEDRELLVGNVIFVGDAQKFVEEKTAEMVKDQHPLGDSYSGQMIRGYRNHYSVAEMIEFHSGHTANLGAAQKNANNPTLNDVGGYMHMAVLPGGERAIKYQVNEGTDLTKDASFAYSFIDSYNDRNVDNTYESYVPGSSYNVVASNGAARYLGYAMRIYITGNEGKTIKLKPFYTKKTGQMTGYYSLNPGDYEFINNDTGKINILTADASGMEFTGNLNGWLIIPDFSEKSWNAGSNAYEGDSLLPGLSGFGAYIRGLTDYEQTVYFGDVLFIRDTDKDYFKTLRRTCDVLKKHDFAPEVTVEPPTCDGPQKIKEYCTRCGEIRYTYGQDALGHEWGEPIHIDPTCTEDGYYLFECIYEGCKESRKEKAEDKLGHGTHGTTAVTVAPAGHKAGSTFEACNDCGAAVTDVTPIAPTCTDTATKLVGKADASCIKEGYTGDKVCVTCGEVVEYGKPISKTAHKYTQKLDKKATLSANGYITNTCSVCSAKAPDTVIYSIASVAFKKSTTTYDGTVKKPTVVVKDSRGKTVSTDSYTVTYPSGMKNAGTYSVKVAFKGNYSGSKTLTYTINPIKISTCTLSLSYTDYTYNGEAKKPSVTVKNANGTTLKKDTHYTVTYPSGRKNVGTYKVKVEMKGNYTGSKELAFTIKPGKTGISSLEAFKKTIKVTVTKKTTQVTGYQIQYSESSKFTDAMTKTITKNTTVSTKLEDLSRTTKYYVRVRTYKSVDGKRYYSAWSATKSIKTK